MSLKLKGTLLGIAASFAGVALFIIFVVAVNIIAGLAGALTGMLFYIVYKKVNYEDTTMPYATILSIVITIVQVSLASYLSYAILANMEGFTFAEIMAEDEIRGFFIRDLLLGLGLSFFVLTFHIIDQKRKGKFTQIQANANVVEDETTSPNSQSSEETSAIEKDES